MRAGRKLQGHARNQNIFATFFFPVTFFFLLMPNMVTLCSHQACVVKLHLSSISFGRNAEEEMLSQEMFLLFSLIKWRAQEQVGVCSFCYINVWGTVSFSSTYLHFQMVLSYQRTFDRGWNQALRKDTEDTIQLLIALCFMEQINVFLISWPAPDCKFLAARTVSSFCWSTQPILIHGQNQKDTTAR